MWVFTSNGFISAVRHREQPDSLMIRARDQDHLKALFPGEAISQTENADYRYRITISQGAFSQFMLSQIENLQYDNFKNSIADHQYHDACSRVWGVMHSTQEGSYYPVDYGGVMTQEESWKGLQFLEYPWADEVQKKCETCDWGAQAIRTDGDITWCTGCGTPL